MNAELHVESGASAGQRFSVADDKFLIGRETDCQFRPDSELVSRHHCVLLQDQYALRVRDMGSRNGTFVNGCQIHGEVVLGDGDTLTLGDVTIKVVLASLPPGAAQRATEPDQSLQGTGIFDGETLPATGQNPVPAAPPPPADLPMPAPIAPSERSAEQAE